MKEKDAKRRILFVDDEPKVLQGLRRMLRSMRNEWEMAFAENGVDALGLLERQHFDVVVSDMRMPAMDGLELLERVQTLYPMIVRIILSGHSDQEMILQSVRSTHQYLSKPCDAESLISTVRRSCALRDILKEESLRRIVSQTERLPALPSLYTELMAELRSKEGSVQQVGQIIEKDVSMSAKILQLVNSSFFGLPQHVGKPSQAVVLLGLDTIRALVLSIGVFSQFNQGGLSGLDMEGMYRHSMRTGAIALAIAKKEGMGLQSADKAFMAGLMHDLGKLILSANLPAAYAEIARTSQKGSMSLFEAEMEKLGATHAQVGAYLLGLWGLPDIIVEAVAFHHHPGMCPACEMTPLTAVYAANILEHQSDNLSEMDVLEGKFDADYMAALDLAERLPEWAEIVCQMDQEAQ